MSIAPTAVRRASVTDFRSLYSDGLIRQTVLGMVMTSSPEELPETQGRRVSPARLAARAGEMIGPEYRARLADRAYLRGLRRELDRSGVLCLEGFLSPGALARLQDEVLELESQAEVSNAGGNHKYSVKGSLLEGTVIDELVHSPLIAALINGILHGDGREALIDAPIEASEIVPGINIMRGPGDVTAFHFDGTFLNILVPVFIPAIEGPNRGQLTIYPNIRSFRKNLYDRLIVPVICRFGLFRLFFRSLEIDYRPGNVYLFYGYRSLHGVLSPAAAGLRCTTNMTVGANRLMTT